MCKNEKVIEKAYAKINLFLDVLSKRPDGYHDIGTVFQTIDIYDELEYNPAEPGVLNLTYNAPQDYPVQSDLVYKAAMALMTAAKEEGVVVNGAHLHLIKNLPLGAGLGGGSADAAAALRLLNREWNLGYSAQKLCAIGAKLGADVPFLVEGGTAIATGIGEILQALPSADQSGLTLVVVTPHCSVPTKDAYGGILPSGEVQWKEFLGKIEGAKGKISLENLHLYNKFEESVLKKFPEIEEMKKLFEKFGAKKTLLSGSGASVFGFFESKMAAENFLEKNHESFRFGTLAQFKELC